MIIGVNLELTQAPAKGNIVNGEKVRFIVEKSSGM